MRFGRASAVALNTLYNKNRTQSRSSTVSHNLEFGFQVRWCQHPLTCIVFVLRCCCCHLCCHPCGCRRCCCCCCSCGFCFCHCCYCCCCRCWCCWLCCCYCCLLITRWTKPESTILTCLERTARPLVFQSSWLPIDSRRSVRDGMRARACTRPLCTPLNQ